MELHDLITPLKISLILPFKAIPEISNPSSWLYAPALVCAGVVLSIRRWYNYSREGIVYVCTIFFTFNVISTYLPFQLLFCPRIGVIARNASTFNVYTFLFRALSPRATLQHPIPTQALHISHVSIAYPFKMVSRRLQTYPALENVQK